MINIFGNGSTVCLTTESTELQPIRITNTGNQIANNVVVTVIIPTGLEYLSDNPSSGTFDDLTNEWTIASIGVGNTVTLDLCFTVLDDTEAPWEITYEVTYDDNPDSVPADDDSERNIEGLACSEFENCPNIPKVDGDENITGNWTFDLPLLVPDDPYDSTSWNGNLEIPTKNALRDKFESLVAGTVPDGDYTDVTVSAGGTVWTIDAGLNAAKIANGSVSNTEFQYLSTVTSDIQTQLDAKVDIVDAVLLTGNQTVGGTKTFTSDVNVPDEAYDATAWNASLEVPTKNAVRDEFETKADDNLVVHLAGAENITGVKTFTADPIIPDEAYDATAWNGSLEPPTKNAIRDKIEALAADIPTLQEVIDAGSTLTSDETITLTTNTLTISGTPGGSDTSLVLTAVGAGNGADISATAGKGLSVTATGANVVGRFNKHSATTNAVVSVIDAVATTTGSAANGLGTAIDNYLQSSTGSTPNGARLKTVVTDVTAATFTTRWAVENQNNGSLAEKLSISGPGKLTLSTYGSGTHTGTATKNLQVDSSGNVIESASTTPIHTFVANIAQTGTGTPTLTDTLINTLGEVPTLVRNGVGDYEVNVVGSQFVATKTRVIVSLQPSATAFIHKEGVGATVNEVDFFTFDAAGGALDLEGSLSITIQVYP